MNNRKHSRLRAHQLKRKVRRYADGLVQRIIKESEEAFSKHYEDMMVYGCSAILVDSDAKIRHIPHNELDSLVQV